MNKNELFEPSFEENSQKTESYNIRNLFYVAFFGGVIPLVCLGTINGKSLQVDKKIINALILFGGLILVAKFVLFNMYVTQGLDVTTRQIRYGYKIASVVLFFAYHMAMSKQFKQHMFFDGTIKPMWKDAIIYILIGIVVEAIVLFAIGGQVL